MGGGGNGGLATLQTPPPPDPLLKCHLICHLLPQGFTAKGRQSSITCIAVGLRYILPLFVKPEWHFALSSLPRVLRNVLIFNWSFKFLSRATGHYKGLARSGE